MDLGQVQLGADLQAAAKIEGGKLIVQFEFALEGVAEVLIDKIEKAVPGDQKAIAEAAKLALKGILG